jgi:hypothetical protein
MEILRKCINKYNIYKNAAFTMGSASIREESPISLLRNSFSKWAFLFY